MNSPWKREASFLSVIKYVFPSILMMVVMSLYTVVDGTFVSRLINTDAFSAVNIVYPLMSFTIGLGTMFGTGVTAIISRKLGQGKGEEANQNFTFIVAFSVALGVLLSVLCLLFLSPILRMLGADDKIFQYCYDYAFPLTFFFFANILQLQFQNVYIADGKPQLGLLLTILGGLANIVLDYLFIAVCGMGIAGAAVATGIGCLLPALAGVFYFALHRKGNIHFVKPRFDKRALLETMGNGSSEMVNCLSTSITTFLFNVIMMRLVGPNGVAAIAILLYLDFILVAIIMGYSIGVAPLFSFHMGAGNPETIRKLYRISIRFCLVFGVLMTAATMLFAKDLARIFTPVGTEVYALAVTGLAVYAVGYLFKGLSIFISAMFTAFGNGRTSAILSFLRTLVFLVCSILLLSWFFGVDGIWFATPLAELLAFVVAVWFARREKLVRK